jgi:hypothetical protein
MRAKVNSTPLYLTVRPPTGFDFKAIALQARVVAHVNKSNMK